MKNIRSFMLLCVFTVVFAACSAPEKQQDKSLYDRLGGKESITAVVNHLWGIVSKDDRINQYFANTDPAIFGSLLTDFLCEGTGGPCTYTGRSMATTHIGMNVTSEAFDALAEDIVLTLNHFDVPAKEQSEVMTMLGGMKNDIINH